jgi:hypothetical protein
MDPSIVSGLSAVLGTLAGGGASITTAWLTQKAQSKREVVHAEIRKRELVYAEFISECSKLAIDALDHALDSPSVLIQVYGLLNRIRLTSSDSVVKAAEDSLAAIVKQYFQPNISIAELRAMVMASHQADPLQGLAKRVGMNSVNCYVGLTFVPAACFRQPLNFAVPVCCCRKSSVIGIL